MRRASKPGKAVESLRGRAVLAVLFAVALALFTLNGCHSPNSIKAQTSDPLVGEKPPEKVSVVGATPPQNRSGMAPAGPPAIASKSIVGMVDPDTLPGSKGLAINGTNDPLKVSIPVQPTGQWQPSPPAASPASGQGKLPVILKVPEATNPTPPPNTSQLQPSSNVVQASAFDSDGLLLALKQRGVVWQDQQQVAGGVRFSCGVASAQDPAIIHNYEATAADLGTAVNAVLQQIDQKR